MNPDELSFVGGDPGAVKHGNFINYYTFHSAKERIDNINSKMLPCITSDETLICLDIGCNTGDLTMELFHYLKCKYPKHLINILAVDIDSALIERAKEAHKNDNLSFVTLDIMEEGMDIVIKKYLDSHKRLSFDVIFCFSVTMWIHLNNGDEGLLKLLQLVKNLSKTAIIETQPWNCYRNAQRRMKKQGQSFEHYSNLKIRNNVNVIIENYMTESHTKLYESSNTSWKRRIQSYAKRK